MWIERNNVQKIRDAVTTRPALLLTGVRQSGKSSLLQKLFPDAEYVTLDKVLLAEEAEINPSHFLNRFEKHVIIDEIQYAPSLFREIKIRIDEDRNVKGKWILTGSQQFNLMQGITESLAGRIRILNLFPLSVQELNRAEIESNPKNYLWKGGFPEVWAENLDATEFFEDYIQTYLERDLKQMLNVSNLRDFRRFLTHLALRTGQLINFTEISKDTGVSGNTIKSWVNLLETSGLIYLVPPFYQNLGKRLIKTPKLFFCDNGLVAALLNIQSLQLIENSPHLGKIWENFVFTELLKSGFVCGKDLFFYRDQNGVEIDFIIEKEGQTYLLEAKYSENPKEGKLNFKKVAPLFKTEIQQLVACTVNEKNPVNLKDFTVFNPLLYSPFE
jgi:uncharacterized protein